MLATVLEHKSVVRIVDGVINRVGIDASLVGSDASSSSISPSTTTASSAAAIAYGPALAALIRHRDALALTQARLTSAVAETEAAAAVARAEGAKLRVKVQDQAKSLPTSTRPDKNPDVDGQVDPDLRDRLVAAAKRRRVLAEVCARLVGESGVDWVREGLVDVLMAADDDDDDDDADDDDDNGSDDNGNGNDTGSSAPATRPSWTGRTGGRH